MNECFVRLLSRLRTGLLKSGGITILSGALILSGCASPTAPSPSAQAQGKLYVGVPFSPPSGSGAIVRFDNPSTLLGDVSPEATITGNLTRLNLLGTSVALDQANDRLFTLVSTGSTSAAILVFDHVSTKNGNLAPDRVIEGTGTGLRGIGPLVVDGSRDILYTEAGIDAANHVEILTFTNASTQSGNVSPSNTLQVGDPGVAASDIVLDQTNNRLFC
jgi:hypothetical protein